MNRKHVLKLYDYHKSLIVKSDGSKVIDAMGKELLDFSSGQFCNILGHNPEFNEAIIDQIRNSIHTGTHFLNPPVLNASEELVKISPKGMDKVILLSTGTEANECAFRIAKRFTDRTGIAGFTKGYSGMSLATRSVSADEDPSSLPRIPGTKTILTPHCRDCPMKLNFADCKYACIDLSFESIGQDAENLAAIIIEPIISDGGMIIPPQGYMKRLQKIAKKHGILIIADEAQTWGRTGKWFGIEHHGIIPDIITFAKGAGNGIPVAGVIVSNRIGKRVERLGLTHVSSHQSDPLGAAAIQKVIHIISRDKLLKRTSAMGRYLYSEMMKLKDKHDAIIDVRGAGLMIGMEIKNVILGAKIEKKCLEMGLILNYTSHRGAIFRIMPPLTVAKKDIELAINIIDEVVSTI